MNAVSFLLPSGRGLAVLPALSPFRLLPPGPRSIQGFLVGPPRARTPSPSSFLPGGGWPFSRRHLPSGHPALWTSFSSGFSRCRVLLGGPPVSFGDVSQLAFPGSAFGWFPLFSPMALRELNRRHHYSSRDSTKGWGFSSLPVVTSRFLRPPPPPISKEYLDEFPPFGEKTEDGWVQVVRRRRRPTDFWDRTSARRRRETVVTCKVCLQTGHRMVDCTKS